MDRDEWISEFRKRGIPHVTCSEPKFDSDDKLIEFIEERVRQAVEAERYRCAKIAESMLCSETHGHLDGLHCGEVASAIRGEK